MYIDFFKEKYEDKNPKERILLIERDKKNLGNIIRERIESDLDNIVDRWWNLESTDGIIDKGDFSPLLRESETLHCYGNYVSAVALTGIGVEELSKYLTSSHNIEDKIDNQAKRLSSLKQNNVITSSCFNVMNDIRKLRNNCIHYNSRFKNLTSDELMNKSKSAVNGFKTCLRDLNLFDELGQDKLIDKLISNNDVSFEDFKHRQRHINFENEKIDLQISTEKKNMVFTSYYRVEEIDFDTDTFKELTLVDLRNGLPVILDLTLPDVDRLKSKRLDEGNIIVASIISRVSSAGITEEWKLLEVHDIYHGGNKLQ